MVSLDKEMRQRGLIYSNRLNMMVHMCTLLLFCSALSQKELVSSFTSPMHTQRLNRNNNHAPFGITLPTFRSEAQSSYQRNRRPETRMPNSMSTTLKDAKIDTGPDSKEIADARERIRQGQRRIQTIERISEQQEKLLRQKHSLQDDEPIMWRLILHNDQVHTFQYVVQSLVKVVGIFTRAMAYEIVVEAHRNEKATIVKVWKEKAQQLCLGLQRQGLTVSIVPDYEFERGNKKMSAAEMKHQLSRT